MIVVTTPARIGIIGNPSDGFNGKTISLTIKNYQARVWLNPNSNSKAIQIIPHSEYDPNNFTSFEHCVDLAERDGYCLGGLRILQATITRFYKNMRKYGSAADMQRLENSGGFTLIYDTNIPRQVGLAGSSAIITSAMKALLKYYNITFLKPEFLAQWILEVETEELGICAGLQDRVVQAFRGLIYMDFNKEIIQKQKHGFYKRLPIEYLPEMFLVYSKIPRPSDSGKIHSNIKERFKNGEEEVIAAMKRFATYTDLFEDTMVDKNQYHRDENKRISQFQRLFKLNFDNRRNLYGDLVIGNNNLEMIEIAEKFGTFAKFSGSGGAIIGIKPDQVRFVKLVEEYNKKGYHCEVIIPDTDFLSPSEIYHWQKQDSYSGRRDSSGNGSASEGARRSSRSSSNGNTGVNV